MCYYVRITPDVADIELTFDAKFELPEQYEKREQINGFAHPYTPVITNENQSIIELCHWGLIPFWAKDRSIAKRTLNAKIETIEKKPAYRKDVNNRCIVIINGFYEWQWQDEKGIEKTKFLITSQEAPIFCLAAIYADWKDKQTGEPVRSFSIVTTEANELMAKIHNMKKRMPVVLTNDSRREWLNGSPFEAFQYPEVHLNAEAV